MAAEVNTKDNHNFKENNERETSRKNDGLVDGRYLFANFSFASLRIS